MQKAAPIHSIGFSHHSTTINNKIVAPSTTPIPATSSTSLLSPTTTTTTPTTTLINNYSGGNNGVNSTTNTLSSTTTYNQHHQQSQQQHHPNHHSHISPSTGGLASPLISPAPISSITGSSYLKSNSLGTSNVINFNSGPSTLDSSIVKEDIKSHFSTAEGIYKKMTVATYARPNKATMVNTVSWTLTHLWYTRIKKLV